MRETVGLTWPEFIFVVSTRAMLAAGVALLVSRKMSDDKRRLIGTGLVIAGGVTTVPAAFAVLSARHRGPTAPDEIEAP